MFDWVKGDVDLKTRLLPFEAFLGLVIAFNTKNVGEKIDRFFKLINLSILMEMVIWVTKKSLISARETYVRLKS